MNSAGHIQLEKKTTFISREKLSASSSDSSAACETIAPMTGLDRASSVSEDMQGLGLVDPHKSILLRFECMSSSELKVST